MKSSRKRSKISGSTSIKGIDRISSLPDDVLHNILSYLSMFEVAQLTLLSKRWQYIIFTTLPYLHFDIDTFHPDTCDFATVDKFKDFINWVFISQSPTKLVRFILCCDYIFDKLVILRWIRAAARRNVQQLVFSCCLGETFELPLCLVTCESLQVLELRLSGDVLKLPNHFGFRQLKFLHLEEVELSDEHLTNSLFSKCLLLETLILKDCSLGAMTLLDIASTSLIRVTIQNNKDVVSDGNEDIYENCEVKISCPDLKFFKYKAPPPKDIIMENLFSIEVVHISFTGGGTYEKFGILAHKMIREVPSTSVLKLWVESIWGLFPSACEGRLCPVSFDKLKSLKLKVGLGAHFMEVMISLLKYSPNLEFLKLWSDESKYWSKNGQMHDPDESIVCLESHLKSILLTGFEGERNEIELVRFFLKNARVLEKLTIVLDEYADKSEEAPDEVSKFPRTSSHVVLTFLDVKPKPESCYWYNTH